MEQLEKELLELISQTCNVPPEAGRDVSMTGPLIGPMSQLDLDSLDAMEIVVVVQKKYGTRIDSEQTSRKVLESIRTLARFIKENRSEP